MMRPWIGCVVVVAACANNVPQDRSTGPDGRSKGAQPIALEEGEGKVRGIVTYPGGDRVDWKLIQLPPGKRGRLELQMTYTTPRPGLRVMFDVFDQYNTPLPNVTGGRGRGRIRTATIDSAMGKYFVRVYAPRRGDAGAYQLVAAFHEEAPPKDKINWLEVPINDPPKLADIPPPPSTCAVFDPNDRACDKLCPAGAPSTWKGCAAPVATPPVPPPTPVVTPTVAVVSPVEARVLKVEVVGNGIEIQVSAGKDHGVTKTWKARVLRGSTQSPLAGGNATIVRIDRRTTTLLVNLTSNVISANPNVVLEP